MSEKQEERKPKFIYSNTATSATDVINLSHAVDGTLLLQLLSYTPEAVYENHRTVLSRSYVNDFIDDLCSAVEYYPKKPRKKITPKKAAKK